MQLCMKQFDRVKVTSIRNDRFAGTEVFEKRSPVVGDVGTILEVYVDAYEVECSALDDSTIWLTAMYPDELGLQGPEEYSPQSRLASGASRSLGGRLSRDEGMESMNPRVMQTSASPSGCQSEP
jgi:hypothetical protein